MGLKNVKMKYNKSYTTHLSRHWRALYDSEVNEVWQHSSVSSLYFKY